MPPNPCRTQPGERRRVPHQELYSSAEAATFANVPNATVYRAMREQQLPFTEPVDGHPRITHEALTRWMKQRKFPVPRDLPRPPEPVGPHFLTWGEAAAETGCTIDDLKGAAAVGLLRVQVVSKRTVRLTRPDLDAWITAGRPRATPSPPRLNRAEVAVLTGLDEGHRLYKTQGQWFLGDRRTRAVGCEQLVRRRLARWVQGQDYLRITPEGRDALMAHTTGRCTPTPDERGLLEELGKGWGMGLVRLVNDEEMPEAAREAEMQCLCRGWAEWRENALRRTPLGEAVLRRAA